MSKSDDGKLASPYGPRHSIVFENTVLIKIKIGWSMVGFLWRLTLDWN